MGLLASICKRLPLRFNYDDTYFGHRLGRLTCRIFDFKRQTSHGDADSPWTRITEHKHFTPWEDRTETVCSR